MRLERLTGPGERRQVSIHFNACGPKELLIHVENLKICILFFAFLHIFTLFATFLHICIYFAYFLLIS